MLCTTLSALPVIFPVGSACPQFQGHPVWLTKPPADVLSLCCHGSKNKIHPFGFKGKKKHFSEYETNDNSAEYKFMKETIITHFTQKLLFKCLTWSLFLCDGQSEN